MNTEFQVIAERMLLLRGPAERDVWVRIGIPESRPDRADRICCPFQVTGLSDDSVRYAAGVDSFQALNLAFAGIREAIRKNASVLGAFHQDFSLTWEGMPWETAIPIFGPVDTLEKSDQLEQFLEQLWRGSAKSATKVTSLTPGTGCNA